MSDRTTIQLQLIDEVCHCLSDARIPHWLFGGWTVDFRVGAITREHDDIDFFIWERDGPRAVELMEAAGYRVVDHPHPEEASIWRKHEQIVELYLMVVNAQGQVVVRGRWEEWPLPENSLGTDIGTVEGVQCPVVSLACILSTKEGYAEYTGIPPRERDRIDILTLHGAMERT